MKSCRLLKQKCPYFILNIVLSLQIIVAVAWMAGNIQSIPLYGDTEEFFHLSKLLKSHSYKNVFYPWVLHILTRVSMTFLIEILYSVQWVLSAIAFYYFFVIGFQLPFGNMSVKKTTKKDIYISAFFPALVMACNPLLTHFNFSVLADGMTLSFSLIFLTSLIACIHLQPARTISFCIMTVSFILMSLMRVEKLYFGILTILLVLLYENFEGSRKGMRLSTKNSIWILVTVCSVMVIYFFVTLKTKIDYGEPGLFVYAMKQVLSAFSSPMAFLHRVIVFGKYLLSPLIFIGEWLPGVLLSLDTKNLIAIMGGDRGWDHLGWSTLWTYYHMLMSTPLLTKIYIMIFILGFSLQSACLLFVHLRIRLMRQKLLMVYLLIFSLANALLFGFFSSYPDMHIRYALPSFISILLTLLLITLNLKNLPDPKPIGRTA